MNITIAIAFFYFIQVFGISPKTNLAIFFVISSLALIAWRTIFSKVITDKRVKNNVVFLSVGRSASRFIDDLYLYPFHNIVGAVQPNQDILCLHNELHTFSDTEHLIDLIECKDVDVLVVGNNDFDKYQRIIYDHILDGIEIIDLASYIKDIYKKTPIELTNTSWILQRFQQVQDREYELLKRLFDVVAASLLLLLTGWLVIIIIPLMKLLSPGPVFYKQTRIGRFGRQFKIVKFRTMVVNAEIKGAQWAQKSDPRITRIGKILRHTHIDEFPQLWNILKGEMSFVGPRPERPEMISVIRNEVPFFSLRHTVKPGITGWAQINHRYGSTVEDAKVKLEYDLYYVLHRSLIFDIKILLRTFIMFARGEGR